MTSKSLGTLSRILELHRVSALQGRTQCPFIPLARPPAPPTLPIQLGFVLFTMRSIPQTKTSAGHVWSWPTTATIPLPGPRTFVRWWLGQSRPRPPSPARPRPAPARPTEQRGVSSSERRAARSVHAGGYFNSIRRPTSHSLRRWGSSVGCDRPAAACHRPPDPPGRSSIDRSAARSLARHCLGDDRYSLSFPSVGGRLYMASDPSHVL